MLVDMIAVCLEMQISSKLKVCSQFTCCSVITTNKLALTKHMCCFSV